MDLSSIQQMHAGTALGIGAVLSAVVAGWQNVKRWLTYLGGFVFVSAKLDHWTSGAVSLYLRHQYKRPPSMRTLIISTAFSVDNDVVHSLVPFEIPNSEGVLVFFGVRGLILFATNNDGAEVRTLRGLGNLHGVIEDAISYDRKRGEIEQLESEARGSSFEIRKVIGTAGDDNSMNAYLNRAGKDDPAVPETPSARDFGHSHTIRYGVDQSFMYRMDQYFRPAEKKSALRGLAYDDSKMELMDYCSTWFRSARWYKNHFIPWKTGLLLHGPGGTGKSSFARVVAETLGIPIYEFYLNTLRDAEFIREWDSMRTPCVVLLDDFDTAFNLREPVTVHKSLSFETVLKQISGISSNNGVLLVITTNHLEKIDPALGRVDDSGRSTRPGRIDKVVEFGLTSQEQRERLVGIILEDWAQDLNLKELIDRGEGTTAAQFQAMCIEQAFNRLQN